MAGGNHQQKKTQKCAGGGGGGKAKKKKTSAPYKYCPSRVHRTEYLKKKLIVTEWM